MAKVFLARASGLGGFERHFAVKVMHEDLRDEPSANEELIKEAKLAARLRHPNVVAVLDVGQESGDVFLVMEYVEGDVLSGLGRAAKALGERLPAAIAMRILADSLAGLHAAHELCGDDGTSLQLVHRDFSPQNILVGVDGVARLTDFGIAKVAGSVTLTRKGLVKGKVAYMSPEQVRGMSLDRRSDIWAAGVVAWELVAGRRLYPPGDDIVTAFRIVSQPPPRLRTVEPETAPALDECIARALSPDLDQRFATAEEFRRALIAALDAPMADPADVARHVQRLVQPALDARAKEIEAVLQRRTDAAPARAEPPLAESHGDLPVLVDATADFPRARPAKRRAMMMGAAIAAALLAAATLGRWGMRPPVETGEAMGTAVGASAPAAEARSSAPGTEPAAAQSDPPESGVQGAPSITPRGRASAAPPLPTPKAPRTAPKQKPAAKSSASPLLPDSLN
jgi:serine/threonine-protein kinase